MNEFFDYFAGGGYSITMTILVMAVIFGLSLFYCLLLVVGAMALADGVAIMPLLMELYFILG